MMAFVFPAKDVKLRLNWYNELRMPMLSAALLTDEGRHNLGRKMQELVDMLKKNPMTMMEIPTDHESVL